jgi:hypothetical protein
MTLKQAEEWFGKLIWENDKCAVRVKEKADSISIVVFQKINGVEYYPLGILLGSNGLDYTYKA